MRAFVIASLIVVAGCRHHADPRLAGTWDLVVDPQSPPSVGASAHVQSGTFEFGDVNATRTLDVVTDNDHQHHTVVTRYLDWHIDDAKGFFAYTKDDENHGDEGVEMELKGDDVSIFDMETYDTFHFHRRAPVAAH